MKQSSSGMKKGLAISLAVLFVVSLTAVAVSARDGDGCYGHGGYGGWGGGYGYGFPCIFVPYCGYVWNPYTNMFVWAC